MPTIAGDLIDVNELARPEVKAAVADDGGAQTDETTEANNDTADDLTLLPAAPATGDAYYIGGYGTFQGATINVSTAGAGTYGLTWEYWDGAAWSALSNVTDDTNDFTTGGSNDVTWDVPGDWATTTVNSVEAYFVRVRVSSFTDLTTQPLGQEIDVDGDRTLVAKTRGTITMSPNANVAESGDHNSLQQDKLVTSEAWEVSFEKQLLAALGGLETLGLYGGSAPGDLRGHSEGGLEPEGQRSIEVHVKEEDGTTLSKYLIRQAHIILEDANIEEDDFSTVSLALHTSWRPEKTA